MIEDVTSEMQEELKEQVKQIEAGILDKIKLYQKRLQEYEDTNNIFRAIESKGYLISQQLISAMGRGQNTSKLEEELYNISAKIDEARVDAMEAQRATLNILQVLYRDHLEYLSNVTNGLRIKCEKLENNRHVQSREDNVFLS